jgi:hypothetical protein
MILSDSSRRPSMSHISFCVRVRNYFTVFPSSMLTPLESWLALGSPLAKFRLYTTTPLSTTTFSWKYFSPNIGRTKDLVLPRIRSWFFGIYCECLFFLASVVFETMRDLRQIYLHQSRDVFRNTANFVLQRDFAYSVQVHSCA